MGAQRNITNAMRSIYGTGNFNPRRFEHKPKRSNRALYLWGLALFLFAVLAVVLLGMYVFGGTKESFTGNRVAFELSGERSPKTADDTGYTLTITNNEEVDLEDLELYIDWPEISDDPLAGVAHFAASGIPATSEANNTWELGNVAAGSAVDFRFTARFAGRAGAAVAIPFSLSFRPSSFTSVYTATHEETFTLGDATISLDISAPSVAAAGSEVLLSVRASGETLAGENQDAVFLELSLPAAFSVSSAAPEPAEEGVLRWPISALAKAGGGYEVSINAALGASAGEKLSVGAKLVRENSDEELVSAQKEISVQNASIAVSVSAVPSLGKKLQWDERLDYSVTVKNTGTYVMRGVVVRLQLPNESLWDSSSLSAASGGFYESGNVFWDSTTTPALDSVRPDASVSLALSLATSERPPRGFAGVPRLVAGLEVKARLGDQEVSVTSEENIVNILADVAFEVSGRYRSPEGAVVGTGPNPPQAGQETTYAVLWTVGPTTSGLRDLSLSTRLPSYVSWKNDSSLAVGEISFDAGTRNVTWKASRVPALELPIEVQFKVSVTPTSELSGSTVLAERSTLSVTDDAVGEAMEFFGNAVTLGNIE